MRNLSPNPLGVITTLLQKGLTEKSLTAQHDQPAQRLHLSLMRTSSPNPIGVINRRNGCGTTLVLKRTSSNSELCEKFVNGTIYTQGVKHCKKEEYLG
ncbi:MAG TPA: hypothetical protein VN414_10060 [Methanosarcina sp.]|nr:hypothetical protein [Methanosarcina sp.]